MCSLVHVVIEYECHSLFRAELWLHLSSSDETRFCLHAASDNFSVPAPWSRLLLPNLTSSRRAARHLLLNSGRKVCLNGGEITLPSVLRSLSQLMLRVETDPHAVGIFRTCPSDVSSFVDDSPVQPHVAHVRGTLDALLTVDECRIPIRKRCGSSSATVFSQESR